MNYSSCLLGFKISLHSVGCRGRVGNRPVHPIANSETLQNEVMMSHKRFESQAHVV